MAQLEDDPARNDLWPFTNLPVYYRDNNNRPYTAPDPDDTLGGWIPNLRTPLSNGRYIDVGTATQLLFQAFGRPPTAYELIGYTRTNNMDLRGANGQVILSPNDIPATVGTGLYGEIQVPVPSTHPSNQAVRTPSTPTERTPTPDPTTTPNPVTNPDFQGPGQGTSTPNNPAVVDTSAEVVAELNSTFSWISEIGIGLTTIRSWIVSDGITSPGALVEKLRGTQQYKDRFWAIRRPDGTLRYSENQYLQVEDQIRQVLTRFGDDQYDYSNPADVGRLMEITDDPREWEQRFQRYRDLEDSSQSVRDAFYMYTGTAPSVDDLYRAIIDPNAADALVAQFNSSITSGIDYETWISRATEVGLRRVTEQLQAMAQSGATTMETLEAVRSIDPEFARQMVTTIDASAEGAMQWDELVSGFELAMIAGAAGEEGFQLPSLERAQLFRNAGVDRSRALQAYSKIRQGEARNRAALQRAGFDADLKFLEDAQLLGRGEAVARLENALSQEAAKGFAGGSARLGVDDEGDIVNVGLRRRS